MSACVCVYVKCTCSRLNWTTVMCKLLTVANYWEEPFTTLLCKIQVAVDMAKGAL